MPVIIKLNFPAGRYHATPWGRHVNEGKAEWPPSPWRLLRALVAVWKRTCPEINEETVRRILESLAEPPRFKLPPHRIAHTRHYMPWEKKGPLDRALIFDTFICIDRTSSLYMGWRDIQLTPSDLAALKQLLDNLSSLGRTESWIHARLTDENIDLELAPALQDDNDPVSVLCADPVSAFSGEHYPTHDPKKLANGKVNLADYLFDCPRWHLCLDTETIHAKRWSMVPGTKWIGYPRPPEQRLIRKHDPKRSSTAKPTVATFVIDGPVLPLVKDTVHIADRFRYALMCVFNRCCAGRAEAVCYRRPDDGRYASPTFSGKDITGGILPRNEHAAFLPIPDRFDRQRIREVIVYAPSGFSSLEITALKSLHNIEFERLSCRTQLIGLGNSDSLDARFRGPSTHWVSQTPFIAHRHAKSRGSKRDIPENPNDPTGSFLVTSVREICQQRGLPLLEAVPVHAQKGQLQFYEFRRERRKSGNDAYTRTAGYLELRFSEPVSGPLSLGYNTHYGMGLFTPDSTIIDK